MKDLREQIESEQPIEEVVDGVMKEETLFERVPDSRVPVYFGKLSQQFKEVYSEKTNIELTDPSLFDQKVISVNYGKRKDESYFVGVQTSRGTMYEIGDPASLEEAEQQAKVLFNSSNINLTDLESKVMRNG